MNPGLNSILSAKKAYVALSTAMRDVICFINLIQEIQDCGIKLLHASKPKVTCQVFRDNVGRTWTCECSQILPKNQAPISSIVSLLPACIGQESDGREDLHHTSTCRCFLMFAKQDQRMANLCEGVSWTCCSWWNCAKCAHHRFGSSSLFLALWFLCSASKSW